MFRWSFRWVLPIALLHIGGNMNRSQALKEAVRRWGKTAAVRDDGPKRASNPERRAAASADLKQFRATIPKDQRPTREQREEIDRLFSEAMRERFTVGVIHTFCGLSAFWVKGTGDSWEEAFTKAEDKKVAKAA